ncbi:MAG: hypothetical protein N2517_09405, partial [Ignavibacteria bacterium]|nr:hypothetical protein [Ignavibacteria bacterium]
YFESYDINSLYQISVELDTKSKTRDGIALETDDAKLTFPPFVVNVLSAKNPGQYYIELNLQSNGSYAVSNISKYVGISGLREALIIDRYFGGNDDDQLWKIKKDKFERVIGIGSTRSKLFDPYTINNGKIVAGADVFIVAYNNALGANWVTIYGGNNDDLANDLDINNNTREIVFIGNTNSPDLPV